MADNPVIQLLVTEEQRGKMRRLAPVAHQLGLTEKPTLGNLIRHGLVLVNGECYRIYRHIQDKGGRG